MRAWTPPRGATLVSNDVRHFHRVEGLLVANWA